MLTEKALKILTEDRRLDPEILSLLGIESVERRDGSDWICFPVKIGDETVNRKYRSISGAKKFSQEPDGRKCFWNFNALTNTSLTGPIVITEGEFDCVAALQSGWQRSVSVPDGAPAVAIGDKDTVKYTYLDDAAKLFGGEREIILATDNDAAGVNLMNDLSMRLGISRCKWVKYPWMPDRTRRCKDLNEVLICYGEKGVNECLLRAEWRKTDGVYTMSDLPPVIEKPTYPCGIEGLEHDLRFRTGDFCVVTGIPSHGKTSFINDVAARMTMRPGWRVAFASFEQQPQTDHKRALRTWHLRTDPRKAPQEEVDKADAWIDRNFRFIVPSEEELPNLEWILEKLTMAAVQHDCKMLIVDPWNELDHTRPPDMSLTEYTGYAIKQFKRVARMLDVFLMVAAHPAKMRREDGKYIPPSLYDISDCYSDDTEVLTNRGWLTHDLVRLDDDVMCFDLQTGALKFDNPSRVVSYDYSGEMCHFKGYGFDLLVSPNHRMVVKPQWREPVGNQKSTGIGRPVKWEKNKWQFGRACELPVGKFSIPKSGVYQHGDDPEFLLVNGRTVPSYEFFEFVGWWVAEGCLQSSGVSLCQAVGKKADAIDLLLSKCGISATRKVNVDKRGFRPMVTWYIGEKKDRWIVDWLKSKCGHGAASKKVPYPLFALSEGLKVSFLNGYIAGDGCRNSRDTGCVASTISVQLRDDLMRLAVETGIPVCSHEIRRKKDNHSQCYQINFGNPERSEVSLRTDRNLQHVPYDGKIWCLTVPTGAYVVRRNGNVSICGNSAHWANKADLGITLFRPDTTSCETELHITKVRYQPVLGKPGKVALHYLPEMRRYECAVAEEH